MTEKKENIETIPLRPEASLPDAGGFDSLGNTDDILVELWRKRFSYASSARNAFGLNKTIAVSGSVTTVASTITETNLSTLTIYPPEFRVGMAVKITAFGVYGTVNGVDTCTIRVGAGNAPTTEWNSIVSTGASVTNQPWNLVWYGIITAIGSSGTIEAQMAGKINNVNKDDPNTGAITLDMTTSVIFAITATWSAANAANTISIRQFIVEILN